MPTLSSGETLHGSRDASDLDRTTRAALDLLPCALCSAPGRHSFRLHHALGYIAVCDRCRESEVAHHAAQDRVDSLHP